MDIVSFLNQTWQEIPDQDNPAMSHFKTHEGSVKQECIMVFKGEYPRISGGGFVVAVNPKYGDITKKGVFWNAETAEFFAHALSDLMDAHSKTTT